MTEQAPTTPLEEVQDDRPLDLTEYVAPAENTGVIGNMIQSRIEAVGPAVIGDAESEQRRNLAVAAMVAGVSQERLLNPEAQAPQATEPRQTIGVPNTRPDYTVPARPGQAGHR